MYPLQSLAIIAPVIFILMMIAFPVIGVFAGWKRALYWGGGTLLFYVTGLVIWLLAGGPIGTALAPMLSQAFHLEADLSKIATSIVAPVFFILFMNLGIIILIINYYAWFRKVAKLTKADKPQAPTVQYRVVNGVVGGVALPALLLPTTFAFTQAVFYGTTNNVTRANNKLANNLYNGLNNCNEIFNWFSYYKKSAQDFDLMYAGLRVNEQISIKLPGSTQEESMSVVQAVEETFSKGFDEIYKAATTTEGEKEEIIKATLDAVHDEMGPAWNAIVDQAGDIVAPIFESDNGTEVIKGLFNIPDEPAQISKETFNTIFAEGQIFDQVMAQYQSDEENLLKTLPITEEGLKNLTNAMNDFYVLTEPDPEGAQQAQLDKKISELVQLLFTVK